MPELDLPGRLLLVSCALVVVGAIAGGCTKRDARTANDIADMACTLFATQEAEAAQKAGLDVGDIANAAKAACNAKERSQPFLDALLSAQPVGQLGGVDIQIVVHEGHVVVPRAIWSKLMR